MIKPHLELVEINTETDPLVGLLYRPSELVSHDLDSKERWFFAPRPGLEPGTYGSTENRLFTKPMFYVACSVVFIDV